MQKQCETKLLWVLQSNTKTFKDKMKIATPWVIQELLENLKDEKEKQIRSVKPLLLIFLAHSVPK